jgi:hypothetical protein
MGWPRPPVELVTIAHNVSSYIVLTGRAPNMP